MNKLFIIIGFISFPFFSIFADENSCTQLYKTKMFNLTKDYRTSLYEGFNGFNTQEEKAEITTFNFRIYKCNLESICNFVNNGILGSTTSNSFSQNIGCPEASLNISEFTQCKTKDIETSQRIFNNCEKAKRRIIKEEKIKTTSEFRAYSEKSKADLISAKLYGLNERMRMLSENMNNLKVYFHKIIDGISCTQK